MEKLIDVLGWMTFIGMCLGVGFFIVMFIGASINEELNTYRRNQDQKRIKKKYCSKVTKKKEKCRCQSVETTDLGKTDSGAYFHVLCKKLI